LRNKHKVTLNTIPMTKARINLGALAKRVHLNKEYVILEKDGIPIVGIMDADEIEDYLDLAIPRSSGKSKRTIKTIWPESPGQPRSCLPNFGE